MAGRQVANLPETCTYPRSGKILANSP